MSNLRAEFVTGVVVTRLERMDAWGRKRGLARKVVLWDEIRWSV
jgi:hypothetical protein